MWFFKVDGRLGRLAADDERKLGVFDLVEVATPGAAEGWTLNPDGSASPPPVDLVAYARRRQASLADGGFAFNVAPAGQPPEIVEADTDVGGRVNLSGLVSLAQLDAGFTTVWVQAGGGITLDAAEILALGRAVGAFVVATYQALAAVLAGIGVGAITSPAQVDAAGWPAPKG